MYYYKIQNQILKDFMKQCSGNRKAPCWSLEKSDDGNQFIFSDGKVAYVIPEEDLYLNPNMDFKETNVLSKILTPEGHYFELEITDEYEMCDKIIARRFNLLEENDKILLDNKKLEYFGVDVETQFFARDKKSPVLITEFGIVVGCIMPIKYW